MNELTSNFIGDNNNSFSQTPGTEDSVPGGTNLIPLPERQQVSNFDDTSGLIFIGVRDFGKNVLENFIYLCEQYNLGYDWQKIKLILVDSSSIMGSETIPFELKSSTFTENFRDYLLKLYSEWGNNSSVKIVLISQLSDAQITRDVYKVIKSIPREFLFRSAFVSFSDKNKVGDAQKSALREFLHWQQRGCHEPNENENEYLKDLFLFDGTDKYCTFKIGLTIFSRFHRNIQSAHQFNTNQGNQPIYINDVKGCGIPVSLILDYYACRLTEQFLFGDSGLFSSISFDQALLDRIKINKSHQAILDRLITSRSTNELCSEIKLYLNNRVEIARWQYLYAALLVKNNSGEKPLINNLVNYIVLNDREGSCLQGIKKECASLKSAIIDALTEKTKDSILRWNVEQEKVQDEAKRYLDIINSNIDIRRIRNEVGSHLQINVKYFENKYSIMPVCIPARWEGNLSSFDYEFNLPDQSDKFINQVWLLTRTWIAYLLPTIPRLTDFSLRTIDKEFLHEKGNVFLSECINNQDDIRLLIKGNNQSVGHSEEYFLPGSKTDEQTWAETNLVLTYQQKMVNHQKLLNYLLERQNGLSNYYDAHLVLADKYESRYKEINSDCPSSWCFCDKLILTLNNPDAVSIFWRAVDRGVIFWSKKKRNWNIKTVDTFSEVNLILSEDDLNSSGVELNITGSNKKDLASLADAYYAFTVSIPKMENDSSGATQKPMHFRNREKYFLSLKRNISLTEKKSDVREWLKKEYEKTGSLEESPEDIYFIQDCYRLYQAIRSEN